jgi:predicted enzyme related to lactoylglutathione lyase
MPTIVHFEVPADDVERSKKFYSDLFGWKIEKWLRIVEPSLPVAESLTKYFSKAKTSCLLKISSTNDSIISLFVDKVI